MNKENMEEKKSLKKIIITVVVLVVIAGVVAVLYGISKKNYNKYNDMGYLNVYGKTLEEYAEEHGYTLEEFKYQFALPEDMPGDTYFDVAYAMMPVRVIAGQEMKDYETFKEMMKIPDVVYTESGEAVEVTHKTPWGLIRDNMILENLYTEEEFLKLKEEFGFGEEITMQSIYREVRPSIEEKALQERLKKEAEEKEEQAKTEAPEEEKETESEEGSETTENSEE